MTVVHPFGHGTREMAAKPLGDGRGYLDHVDREIGVGPLEALDDQVLIMATRYFGDPRVIPGRGLPRRPP